MEVKFEKNHLLEDHLVLIQAKEKTAEIESIIGKIENTKTVLRCSHNDQNFMVPCNEFIRFFSANKRIYGETSSSEYLFPYRLYELDTMLQSNFIRISNTEIINVNFIKSLELTSSGIIIIYFKNGNQTSSSRRYLKLIKECLL
ncbi:LytTR family DNA-binding domain-containing protein [Enterococcus sp. LJL98]